MRASRGMGAIKKSKIPGAMPNKMPAGKVKGRPTRKAASLKRWKC